VTQELKHKAYGTPFAEWIEQIPYELDTDAIGLWQIVSDGRLGFGLEGSELVGFLRRALVGILGAGGRPVVGGGEGPHDWILERRYGTRSEDVIENVLREWIANGMRDEDPGGLWFVLPEHAWMPPE
jgi:hypothetical protein